MGINRDKEQYERFKKKQLELADMLGEASGIIEKLDMSLFHDNLKKLEAKVENDSFKIQIVGTFKNGKSTFINSFLGEEILPAYALPCTAVINEVKYGEQKRAVLYFRNPLPENLPDEIPDKAMQHMQKFSMKDIPPLEIPYDEIEDYVVIPMGKDLSQSMLESPYEKVELFYPLDLLKNGIEIIDSPGLKENAVRTKVTMDYLTKADAIIFVLLAIQLCHADEMDFIENNLYTQGFEEPFFVVNKYDLLQERDKPGIQNFAKRNLTDYTNFGESGIYFVSALNALNAKIENDEKKYNDSGMAGFTSDLSAYLTKQKGKAKLSQPARELKRILNEEALFKTIPRQKELLRTSLDDVKARYEAAKPRLSDLKTRKDQLHHRLMLSIERSRMEFTRIVKQNIMNMVDSVPAWVNEYEPVTKIGVIPKKEKISALVTEISDYVTGKVEEEQRDWKDNTLLPIIQNRAADIFESVESDLAKIFQDLDSVQIDISGEGTETAGDVPVWSRIAGTLGGMFVGGLGVAAVGGIHGISKELGKSLAIQVGAILLLNFIGLWNPVTFVGLMVVQTIGAGVTNESKVTGKVKEKLIAEVVNKLSEESEENTNALVKSITDKFTEMADEIIGAVDAEINETDRQIQKIIAEMEKGRENIAAKEAVIAECETDIKNLSTKLDNLIFELMEG